MANDTLRIFAGRFQPFHNGHLWIVQTLIRKYGRLIIGVVNPDPEHPADNDYPSFRPLYNPFDFWERQQMIRQTALAAGFGDLIFIVPLQHPRAEISSDQAFLPRDRTWVVPPLDEHESDKIVDLERLGEDVESIEVPDTLRYLSSSVIRQCLRTKKGACLCIAAAPAGRCCPPAVGETLKSRSAVLRLEQLTRRFRSECGDEAPPCRNSEQREQQAVMSSAATELLAECRRFVDVLYAEPTERARVKEDQIKPLEARVRVGVDAGVGADSATEAAVHQLHTRLRILSVKAQGHR